MEKIENAKITSTMLGFEDRGIFTYMIQLGYGGSTSQGFGGRVLGGEYTTEVIKGILGAAGVDSWEKLPGTHVRARLEAGRIVGIGHILEDKWYTP